MCFVLAILLSLVRQKDLASRSSSAASLGDLEISPLYVHGSAERLIGELQRLPTNDKFGMCSSPVSSSHQRHGLPATKRMSTHTGNNLIIYCVGGNASLLAVPGSIKHIFGIGSTTLEG
ncbi:hypothetical protein HD554DRAFT_2043843 [Boletus coccyginus]|nr:hypothetical protein HD554DRAFT_2043843 [Boletus coccyginus]